MNAGLSLWFTICTIITAVVSIYLVKRYARPDIDWSIKAIVALSWFMAFSVIYLIGIDVDPNARAAFDIIWKLQFWGVQILLLWTSGQQDYAEAGDFNWKGKLKTSLKINAKILGGVGIIFLIFVIYIAVTQNMDKDDVMGFIVALANTIGLTLLIMLLGHGLVELPRKFWHEASMVIRMKHFLYKIKQIDSDLEQAKEDMKTVLQMYNSIDGKVKKDNPLRQYVDVIQSKLPQEKEKRMFGIFSSAFGGEEDSLLKKVKEANEIDESLLAEVHFRVMRVVSEMRRVQHQWDHTIDKATKCEAQVAEMNEYPCPEFSKDRNGFFLWFFKSKYGIRQLLMRFFSLICGVMSFLVVWCEMTMFSSPSMSVFGVLVSSAQGTSAVGVQIFAFIPLTYICACAYFSAFRLRIPKLYHLHDGAQTDANSLLYNAQLLLRLVVGIGYNYMIILRVKSSAFLDIMGEMDVVPLFGNGFVIYFPILICFFCTATAFNLWQYFLKCLGVKVFEFNERGADEILAEGKALLDAAKRKKNENARQTANQASTEAKEDIISATSKSVLNFFKRSESSKTEEENQQLRNSDAQV